MTKNKFKEILLKRLEEVKKANELFIKVHEVLNQYNGKKIGEKTKDKINKELKEKYSCHCYLTDTTIEIVPLENGYSCSTWYKFTNKVYKSLWLYSEKSGGFKFQLEEKENYYLLTKLTNLINKDLDEYIEELETNYKEVKKLDKELEEKVKKLGNGLYTSFYKPYDITPYDFEDLLKNILIRNSFRY